jgi:endonuclease/exonuclease/phosphatase family metal-dependent hydrolase
VISAHVEAPTGEYTFVAVHIEPPWPNPPGEWTRELSRLKGVLAGLPTDTPLIAAGDFNATVDHSQFRALLQHGVADAADQAGAGYDPSYPADRWFGPVIAIDHVLTRHAVATSLSTVDLPNSDHRGLLVHVALDPT